MFKVNSKDIVFKDVAYVIFSINLAHSCILVVHFDHIHVQRQIKKVDQRISCHCPTTICLLKVKNRSTRKISEICSKLATETPERRY